MREMKDSGVEWIGEIPKEWKLVQIRYIFRIGRGRVIAQTELNEDGMYPVYSSQTKNNGCMGYLNTYDFDCNQITWTTDGANAGTVFYRIGKHSCTNVCGTLQPIVEDVDLRYQKYALEHICFYHKRSDTNGFKIMNNEMAAIHTLYPNLYEQQKIANYLDNKCSKIDYMIEKQQAIIDKLKEYKQSLITETITKGLNSGVTMKDSRIEWIGKIPENSIIVKLKRIVSKPITDGIHITPTYDNKYSGSPFLSSKDVSKGYIDWTNIKYITQDLHKELYKNTRPQRNDILLAKNGTTGVAALVETDDIFDIYVTLALLTPNPKIILPKYLLFYINSLVSKKQFDEHLKGSGVPNLHLNVIRDTKIILHTLYEQQQIIDYLDKKCGFIDKSIEQKQSLINKLIDYKKSLIYEVVTGKKEV